jgi:hypothetical protein
MTIDDFLLDAAILLGTTQKRIETEFYMLDVFEAVRRHNRNTARNRLVELQITNSRYMEQAEFKKFVKSLNAAAQLEDKAEEFNRDAMDALHAFTNSMK